MTQLLLLDLYHPILSAPNQKGLIMAHAQYLFLKDGTYYFRRRISGFPHKTSPLMISLGSKELKKALYIVQHVQTEYLAM